MYWFDKKGIQSFSSAYTVHQLKHWDVLNHEMHWMHALRVNLNEQVVDCYDALSERDQYLLFSEFLKEAWEQKMSDYQSWMSHCIPVYEFKIEVAMNSFRHYGIPFHVIQKRAAYGNFTYTSLGGARIQTLAPNPEKLPFSLFTYRTLIGSEICETDVEWIQRLLYRSNLNLMDQAILGAFLEIENQFQKECRFSGFVPYSILKK